MDVRHEVLCVLDEVLGLNGRTASFGLDTPLLGAVAELDSMAVVSVLTTLEERLGVAIGDDIGGDDFATVGSLVDMVSERLAA